MIFYELAKSARVFLDVGANTGYFTLLSCAASDSCRSVCFEPAPRTRQLLMDNLSLNDWTSRCEVREEAVSDAPGKAFLIMPYYHLDAALEGIPLRVPEEMRFEVTVTTIDSIAPSGADLVKMDIERHEHKALAGMPQLLADSKPTIILEVSPGGPVEAIHEILDPLGYKHFHLLPEGPREMKRIEPDPAMSARNYLCAARREVIDFVRGKAIGSR